MTTSIRSKAYQKKKQKSWMDKKPQNLSTFIKYRVGAHWSEYLNQGIVCILH